MEPRRTERVDGLPDGEVVPPRHERPPQPRREDRRPRRGDVRPRLPVGGPPGRAGPQAGQGDGRAPHRLGVAHLRPQRVRRLALAGGPRALRGRRAGGHRRARRLPARARPPRAPRAGQRARRSSSAPTTASRSASSASRRAWSSPRPPRAPARRARARPADMGHTMVYSTSDRHQAALEEVGSGRRAARGRAVVVAAASGCVVPPGGALIGRSRECDIVLDDSNVSRRHAEIRPSGAGLAHPGPGLDQRRARQRPPASTARTRWRPATASSSAPSTSAFEVE